VTLSGNPVKVLREEDFLLHLCLHASLNAFSIFAQLRDIHALLAHPDSHIETEQFWDRARRYRVLNPAAFGIELARYFGTSRNLEQLRVASPVDTRVGALTALLQVENLVRQRLRNSAVGGRAVSLLRRDQLKDRLSFLGKHGLNRAMRFIAFMLLARQGWEIESAVESATELITEDELIKV
jgi:hypothetical protein